MFYNENFKNEKSNQINDILSNVTEINESFFSEDEILKTLTPSKTKNCASDRFYIEPPNNNIK